MPKPTIIFKERIMALYPKLILDALEKVRYPGNGKNLVEAEMVDDNIRIDGNKVSFSLIFDKPTDPFIRSVVKSAEAAIHMYVGKEVEIEGNITVVSRQAARPEVGKFLPQVKNVIAVSSGKGGVGIGLQGRSAGCRYIRSFNSKDVQRGG